MSSATRRRLALVLSLLMVGSVVAVTAAGLTVTPTSGTGVLDGDDDGKRLTHAHSAADPALQRGTVVHLTSHGDETWDYAMTVVDIKDTKLQTVHTLEFDYYEGEENANAAPDEVWLVLQNDTGRHIVWRTFNDETVIPAERWKTQSVVDALEDSDRPWREVDNAGEVSDPRAVLENLSEDNISVVGTNLTAAYGKETELLAVGVGHGAPRFGPTTVDLYVDDLQVKGKGYNFPVARADVKPDPFNLDSGGTDCVVAGTEPCANATIDLNGNWSGRTVHDINVSTVRLNGTAPIDGSAQFLDADGDGVDELRLQFNKTEVGEGLETGSDVPVTADGVFLDDATGLAATDHIDVVDDGE